MAIFGIEYVETVRGYFGVEADNEQEALERFEEWRLSSEDVYNIMSNTDNIDGDTFINEYINVERDLYDDEILTEEKYQALQKGKLMAVYKDVEELTKDELWELKDRLYWNTDAEFLTDEQRDIVENADIQDDIPDELIYDVFGCYDFVNDDFWCNV